MNNIEKLISVIIITYSRKNEVENCLDSVLKQDYRGFEIILVDNNEDEEISVYLVDAVKRIGSRKVRYFKTPQNLGVTGGRNFGIKKAEGEILVFIDDDAFFRDKNALRKIYEKLIQDGKTGVLSFKIINYYSGEIEKGTFPHLDKKLDVDKEFETTYFLGGGCAIKKEIFNKIGYYSNKFFYGMEELDLSFKLLDVGYRIFYFPQVIIFHKKSLKGRLSNKEMWKKILENRISIAVINLPWLYVIISTIVWSGKVLIEVNGDIFVLLKAFRSIIKKRENLRLERKKIGRRTILKLKSLNGRLFY